MTSRESISRAQTSKNLGEKPADELADVDIIRAVGMAAQVNPLGLSVFRWRYSGDQRSVYKVAEGLVDLGYAVPLVYRVLMHMVNDVCPKCFGRGYGTIFGTPVLDDEVCSDCRGTGRKELFGNEEKALMETIKRYEQEMATAVMKKLSRRLDF